MPINVTNGGFQLQNNAAQLPSAPGQYQDPLELAQQLMQKQAAQQQLQGPP